MLSKQKRNNQWMPPDSKKAFSILRSMINTYGLRVWRSDFAATIFLDQRGIPSRTQKHASHASMF